MRLRVYGFYLVPFIAALLLWYCRTPHNTHVKDISEDEWNKRAWMDKAARILWPKVSGLTQQELAQFSNRPRNEIIDLMMQDRRFGEMVLDFNTFYLGIKTENPEIRVGNAQVNSSSALIAAWELLAGGDYFKIFDWRFDYTLVGTIQPPSGIPQEARSAVANSDNPGIKRRYWLSQATTKLQNWLTFLTDNQDVNLLCRKYLEINDNEESYRDDVSNAGLSFPLSGFFNQHPNNFIACGALGLPPTATAQTRNNLIQEAQTLLTSIQQLEKLPGFDVEGSYTLSFQDLYKITPAELAILKHYPTEAWGLGFWVNMPNSSTNLNRKRAAYVLKTYFCDDLTPLNIVAPQQHAQDRHGSDASCAACHYKLDPMAGFFKDRGIAGINFQGQNRLVHDDQYVRQGQELQNYRNSWKFGTNNAPRVWNIGYVRSATDQSLNEYGETVQDLFQIIRKVPETKVCLTKRLAEYTLGIDQVYDNGWIEHLAQNFIQAGQPNVPAEASSTAFKHVVKSLLLSKTFSQPDPVKGQCYDRSPTAQNSDVPCEVAYILEENCTTCHSGDGASGGLDLTKWQVRAGGIGQFAHRDPHTQSPLNKAESFSRILERLSTNDLNKQMPLDQHMDPVARANLFKWVQHELTKGQ